MVRLGTRLEERTGHPVVNKMNWTKREREIGFYHPTPAWVTEALLRHEKFSGKIWEPCCGRGHISECLKAHKLDVYSSDIKDRGYGDEVADFFDTVRDCDHIITNTPWLDFENTRWHFFATQALYVAKKKVALLLPFYFTDARRRRDFLAESPLKAVYVFRGNVFQKHTIAWFVWQKRWRKEPVIRWLTK